MFSLIVCVDNKNGISKDSNIPFFNKFDAKNVYKKTKNNITPFILYNPCD